MIKFLFASLFVFAHTQQTLPDGFSQNDVINVSVISKKEADQLMRDFLLTPELPREKTTDACYARATKMAQIAEDKKIEMAKVFSEGTLRAKTASVLNPVVEWRGFHVAPVAFVSEKGKVELMVFDPGLFSKPVTVAQWNRKMSEPGTPEPKISVTYFGSRFQFMSRGSNPVKRDSWRSQDKSETERILKMFRDMEAKELKELAERAGKGIR